MSSLACDPIDAIMAVMEAAFDPDFGEAWNRRQVGDALALGNCRYYLSDRKGRMPARPEDAAGFILSRQALDEEELLLIAVRPEWRRKGIASALFTRFAADARLRGVHKIFLEMRKGNSAGNFYTEIGFDVIGSRPNYYNRGRIRGIDAITYAIEI